MPVRLYMDVHIPLVITEGLRRCGLDVLTAQQDGADRLDDDLLLQRATTLSSRDDARSRSSILGTPESCLKKSRGFGGYVR